MNPLQFGRKRISKIIWDLIEDKVDSDWGEISGMCSRRSDLHKEADKPTGSLSVQDAIDVYRVTKLFNPKVIAEVGTYIGVSTEAMRMAAPDATIYTCDMSNDIDVGLDANIIQYPKQTSHEMFSDLVTDGVKVDLVYLDGRLSPEDMAMLRKLIHDRTVFVLDDFEGVEKGVANAMFLANPNWMMVYPHELGKTAILIPYTLLQFVPQESV